MSLDLFGFRASASSSASTFSRSLATCSGQSSAVDLEASSSSTSSASSSLVTPSVLQKPLETVKIEPRSKRIKIEPGSKRVKIEPGARDEAAAKLKALLEQVAEAQEELNALPPQVKTERSEEEDDGFRVMVSEFAKQSSNTPFLIDDSP